MKLSTGQLKVSMIQLTKLNSQASIMGLAFFTMCAFAGNSILCRLAIKDSQVGAIEFTVIRLLAGALMLAPHFFPKYRNIGSLPPKSMPMSVCLFTYCLFFSLAYNHLTVGTGALILFASVQMTMIATHLFKGNSLCLKGWGGAFLGIGGLAYLLLPGLDTPPLISATLMVISGISWGFYSVLGKTAKDPIYSTAANFLMTLPLLILLSLTLHEWQIDGFGLILAVASGALTSGLGYVLWYFVLKRISLITASLLQLSVPLLANLGGLMFVGEVFNSRLVISSALVLFGIFLTLKRN